jgi:hypothetical protein
MRRRRILKAEETHRMSPWMFVKSRTGAGVDILCDATNSVSLMPCVGNEIISTHFRMAD